MPALPEQRLLKLNAARRLVVGKPAARRVRFGSYLNRSRRVLLTLAGVWVVGVFDLGFTLSEWGSQHFIESNPLAAHLLHGPESFVMAFKFGLLGFGTIIMLTIRKHAVAELACWFMLTCQVYVAARWYAYFNCVLNDTTTLLVMPLAGN